MVLVRSARGDDFLRGAVSDGALELRAADEEPNALQLLERLARKQRARVRPTIPTPGLVSPPSRPSGRRPVQKSRDGVQSPSWALRKPTRKLGGAVLRPLYLQPPMDRDYVDIILEQWSRERPDLDASPMGVIGRISRVSRVLEREIEQVWASYGLSRGGFDVLAALRRSGPPYRLSPTELYNSLLISSGAMTNRVDRLEERKLVSRIPDPMDRRGVLVALTPKGKQLIDKVTAAHLENEQVLLQPLTQREREQIAALLRKLLVNFDDHTEAIRSDEQNRPVA